MRKLLFFIPLAALVVACATNPYGASSLPAGTPRAEVIARLGAPTRVVRLPNGNERLQYSLQPYGQVAWMMDLDASGRLVQGRQVLNEGDFRRIELDKWTREDVEREFGRPALVDGVASWNGPIMTYRWRDTSSTNMFYWVYLDPANVVRRAHPGMDNQDDPDERF